jgi:hypothetical protein
MHPHRRAADRQRHRPQQRLARLSSGSIYHYARDAGLKTAAAAYHWVSELYNRTVRTWPGIVIPMIRPADQHGHFYWNDHYPDSHLFADAENLRLRHAPTFC